MILWHAELGFTSDGLCEGRLEA